MTKCKSCTERGKVEDKCFKDGYDIGYAKAMLDIRLRKCYQCQL